MSDSSSRFVSLASVSPEEQPWLWPDRIAMGTITLLEGDPGQGKSLIICDWTARVSRGWSFPGDELKHDPAALADTQEFPVPAGVVLLAPEDHLATTVVPRLLAAGADLSRVLALHESSTAEGSFQLPRDVPVLEQHIQQAQARLVVIDPLSAYLPSGLQSDSQVRLAMQSLAGLAQRTGVAIVLVRHFVKENCRRATSAGAGGIAIMGRARAALAVTPLPKDFDPHRDLRPLPEDANGVVSGKLSSRSLQFTHCLTVVKGNLGHAPPLIYRTGKNQHGELRMQYLGIYEPHPPNDSETPAASTPVRIAQAPLQPVRSRRGRRWLSHGWSFLSGVAQGVGRGTVCLCRAIGSKRRRRRRR